MAERVFINDVGPRDGLQNQSKILAPQQRLELISALVKAGLGAVEVGSFVSPKAVPAMAGTDEIVAGLPPGNTYYSALIPNRRGYDLAVAAGVKAVGIVVASTQMMNEKNIRQSTEQAMAGCAEIIAQSKLDGIDTLAYVATAWECPFEGTVDASVVIEMTGQMLDMGATRVVVADTIGAANPAQVKSLMGALVNQFGADRLACHFHDTRGMGVADVYAAVQEGIRHFDASIGGLGGCPFAPGATGNVATEDVVVMLEQMGFDTGINLPRLVEAVDLATELTGNCDGGHSLRWVRRQIEKGVL
ncbi:MAG: hydroxymethylglutaryl-CoA lyase [Pseudomonadales bacterium]